MNFLNKAKEQANNIINKKEGSPMTNPFLNKNTQAQSAPKVPTGTPTAPAVPGAPTKPGIPPAPKAPGKPGVPPMPGKPGVPPTPKAPVAPTPNAEKPAVAPAVPGSNPFAKKAESAVVAPKEEVVEEKVETKAPVEEVKAETVETPVASPEEVKTEEAKAEEKAKEEAKVEEEKKSNSRRRTSSRKKTTTSTAKTEEVKDAPSASQEAIDIVVNTTELSYAEACQAVRTHFVDEEWEAAKNKFEEMSKSIHISNDMNKAQLHDLLAQVSNLRDEIYVAYTETKTLYEHLTDKENGLIERTKRTGSKGSNAEERKLTSTLAVMNYVDSNGNKINLYEVLDETRIRYNFLKGINETVEFKKAVLLTMLSSLKSN